MSKTIWAVIFFLALTLHPWKANAQVQNIIDSLENCLQKPADDTTRANQLNAICFYNYSVNPERGIEYGNQAKSWCEKIGWKKGLSHSHSNLACCYYTKSNYTDAVTNWLLAIRFAEQAGEPTSAIIGNLGNVYGDLGDNEKALESYLRAEASPDWSRYERTRPQQMTWLDENIGHSLLQLGRFNEAKKRFQKIVSLFDKPSLSVYTLTAYTGLAQISAVENKADSAFLFASIALRRLDSVDDLSIRAATLYGISKVFFFLSKLSSTSGDKRQRLWNPTTLLEEALRLCDSSVAISSSIQDKGNRLRGVLLRSEILEYMGKSDAALADLRDYQSLKDSLFSMRQSQQLAELNFNFEQEKRDVLSQKTLDRQTLLRNGFIGGFIIVALFLGIVIFQRGRIKEEKNKRDELLHNVLPPSIAHRMLKGEKLIAEKLTNVSVLFADIVNFTKLSQSISAEDLVAGLDTIFSSFDALAEKHGLEKIKTIGDAYMVVCGAPEARADHALAMAHFALEMQESMKEFSSKATGESIQLRIGIHTGDVVAGVIGKKKFAYDLWGDAVNTASRMESHGEAGRIHLSEDFKQHLTQNLSQAEGQATPAPSLQGKVGMGFLNRGEMKIKGKGTMRTYFLEKA